MSSRTWDEATSPETRTPVSFTYGHETRRLAIIAALAGLADWLFYGHPVGISAVVFLVALAAGAMLAEMPQAIRRRMLLAGAVLALALAPFVVEPGLIASLFAAMGAALAIVIGTGQTDYAWRDRLSAAARLLLRLGWQALPDLLGIAVTGSSGWGKRLSVWIVPLSLGAIFLSLFSSANPVIENLIRAIDLDLLEHLSAARIIFWIAMLALVWPFIFLRPFHPMLSKRESAPAAAREEPLVFGRAAILRSLLLFNLLFAVQTLLDAIYLWGGAALPQGVTYASYAHRGAYPLIVTALLAAAFVILATRPGSEAAGSRPIRALVYLWTGQNILLVISAILRLDLYVSAYSLTYWRLAAFIWMLLVTAGLILILARIVFDRSNAWLVGMNAAMLAATLYACSLINLPNVIARYNIEHSREISGDGARLDLGYMGELGPHAIPAFDRFIALMNRHAADKARDEKVLEALVIRNWLAFRHLGQMQGWRAWSVRDWRLARSLGVTGPVPPPRPAL